MSAGGCELAGLSIEELDRELVARARLEGCWRLRLGQALEVLGRGGCFELGFSSIAAYALERAERSVRWTEGARCVARRLEELPLLRAAVAAGVVSWSMGELLARVASPRDEATWLERARGQPLRQVRQWCARAPELGGPPEEGRCTLTLRVTQEEAWLFEATRALLEALGTRSANAQMEALLAEAQDSLLAALPRDSLAFDELERYQAAHARWQEHLQALRNREEAAREQHLRPDSRDGAQLANALSVAREAASGCVSLEGMSALELDGLVRGLCSELAAQELTLSMLISQLHQAEGWRHLGYATPEHYARERLGMSRSSWLGRRALASRVERLPAVAAAWRAGHIGVEAALQLVRIATPRTEQAWVERARRRTVKHLREEVAAALLAVRMSGEADCLPPREQELTAVHELERRVLSGEVCRDSSDCGDSSERKSYSQEPSLASNAMDEGSAWAATLQSLESWLQGGVQLSAAGAPGTDRKVVLRLRMSGETLAWWRALEQQSRGWLLHDISWVQFLCLCLWRSWRHLLGERVAYGHIYIRDRHRCTSPVCNRTDVTPHHLVYRSAGGSDDDENVTSLCSWCHLHGVHGGRIRARGPASCICWELPVLRVRGREKEAA